MFRELKRQTRWRSEPLSFFHLGVFVTVLFTESVVEQAAPAWLESAGWSARNGAEIAPGESNAERIIGLAC